MLAWAVGSWGCCHCLRVVLKGTLARIHVEGVDPDLDMLDRGEDGVQIKGSSVPFVQTLFAREGVQRRIEEAIGRFVHMFSNLEGFGWWVCGNIEQESWRQQAAAAVGAATERNCVCMCQESLCQHL